MNYYSEQDLVTYEEPTIQKIEIEDCFIEQFREDNILKKHIVKRALNQNEQTTNNDRLLDLQCLLIEFKFITLKQDKENIYIKMPKNKLKFLPSPETYTRIRRKLNQEGIGLPTNEKVAEHRMKKEKALRKYYGENKE